MRKGKKVRLIQSQIHLVNDGSVDCKKTDSLGASSLTSPASASLRFFSPYDLFFMRRDGLSILKACSYIFYLICASGSHVTWNSAVPDPNVWCCILLFLCTLGTRRMQALWGEPWTARSVFIDRNEVVPFRGDVKDLWLLGTCQAMHGEAVKARPGREKKKMVAAQGSNSSVPTLRIRFLPLVVFSVLSCTFSEHYRKKSVDPRPPKSKAEFRTPIVDLLWVKEG